MKEKMIYKQFISGAAQDIRTLHSNKKDIVKTAMTCAHVNHNNTDLLEFVCYDEPDSKFARKYKIFCDILEYFPEITVDEFLSDDEITS